MAVLSAAVLTVSQGAASADNIGWSFSTDSPVAAGSKFLFKPQAFCDVPSCDYSSSWGLTFQAVNGSQFLNDVGSSFALVQGSTGGEVGTCTVADATDVMCQPSADGSIAYNDDLTLDQGIAVLAAAESCTPVVQGSWYGEDSPDATLEVTTLGNCDS
ncbi:hypothetical protein OG500_02355 [Kitasatospora sp. NBC_01250]|uniref:hypothetical protein n=1 Tax=Kitasatospora sp. NBC_01250 TaxID=2903571 RepID=UPI002E33F9A7|nr:hypothetical protein [Kitasatospora sp. NBC_01250]